MSTETAAYHRPQSLQDALRLVGEGDARPIAGGTDLFLGDDVPTNLVSLRAIPSLRGIQGAFPLAFAKVQGGAMFYRHDQIDRRNLMDLNQVRLNLSLEIPIGSDPGLRGGGN